MINLQKLLSILHPLQRVTVVFSDRKICGYAYNVFNQINYQRPEYLLLDVSWDDVDIDYETIINMSTLKYSWYELK